MRRLEHIELETWQLEMVPKLSCCCFFRLAWRNQRQRIYTCWLSGFPAVQIGTDWKGCEPAAFEELFGTASTADEKDIKKSLGQNTCFLSLELNNIERFSWFPKQRGPSEMLHFATCQEILRLAKAWF